MQLPDPAAPPALQLPPAAIQNITPIDESEQLDVTLSLVSLEGATSSLKCCRHSTLRSLQRNLCASFGKNYPHTAAAVCIENITYADFDDVPFLATENHQVVNVVFYKQQADPSGYDIILRSPSARISLEEECSWEQQLASGETNLALKDWYWARRCTPAFCNYKGHQETTGDAAM